MNEEPTSTKTKPKSTKPLDELVDSQSPGLIREFVDFVLHNNKWWMLPVLAVLLLLGGFVLFSGSAAATLIYTLF
jgi:hypothetical protein